MSLSLSLTAPNSNKSSLKTKPAADFGDSSGEEDSPNDDNKELNKFGRVKETKKVSYLLCPPPSAPHPPTATN